MSTRARFVKGVKVDSEIANGIVMVPAPFEGQPVSLVVTHTYRCLGITSAMIDFS